MRLLASLLLALLVACTEDPLPPPPPDVECTGEGRYLPLVPGARWTYQVDDGELGEKTQTVGPLEDVGGAKAGTLAYRMTTTKPGGGETISWQEDTGTAIRRHRELDRGGETQTDEVYTPFRTRLDESPSRLVVGATWRESYAEIVTDAEGATTSANKTETWVVEAVDEPIAVPAGDFCALRVGRTSVVDGNPGSAKTYWYARGVGKVRESGDHQIEELVAFGE